VEITDAESVLVIVAAVGLLLLVAVASPVGAATARVVVLPLTTVSTSPADAADAAVLVELGAVVSVPVVDVPAEDQSQLIPIGIKSLRKTRGYITSSYKPTKERKQLTIPLHQRSRETLCHKQETCKQRRRRKRTHRDKRIVGVSKHKRKDRRVIADS